MKKTYTQDGVRYYRLPEHGFKMCRGCDFSSWDDQGHICSNSMEVHRDEKTCGEDSVIYVRSKRQHKVDAVLAKLEDWEGKR